MCMAVPGVPTNSGKGSPVRAWEKTPGCTRSGLLRPSEQAPAPGRRLRIGPRPRPHPKSIQPPRVQRQHRAPPRRRPPLPAVRPAGPGGWRRPGRLHAPEAARTGPVSASRRYLSWSPRGRRVNGQNGHFSCQLGRDRHGTPNSRYGSGFNGPRDFSRGLAIFTPPRAGLAH